MTHHWFHFYSMIPQKQIILFLIIIYLKCNIPKIQTTFYLHHLYYPDPSNNENQILFMPIGIKLSNVFLADSKQKPKFFQWPSRPSLI